MNTFLALMVMCVAAGQAMHLPILTRPPALESHATWNDVVTMSGSAKNDDHDHETQLLPDFYNAFTKEDNCCISVMILKYYLKHILHTEDKHYPRISHVWSDLHSVLDYMDRCKAEEYSDHVLVKRFAGNYKKASELYGDVAKAKNKAVGETGYLLHHLYTFCYEKKY